jgi:hypothetical protein
MNNKTFDVELGPKSTGIDLKLNLIQDSVSLNCGFDSSGTEFCGLRGPDIKACDSNGENCQSYLLTYEDFMSYDFTTSMLKF